LAAIFVTLLASLSSAVCAKGSGQTTRYIVDTSQSSGILVGDADGSIEYAQVAGSSYYVELAAPQDLDSNSFVRDLRNNLLPDDYFAGLDASYLRKLNDYRSVSGFYVMNRDSRLKRPYGVSLEQERDIRNNMAKSTRKYMLMKGIPRFLKSRPDTRYIGQAADDAVETAQRAATIEVRNEQGWSYSYGLDPFNSRAFARTWNKTYRFESKYNIDSDRLQNAVKGNGYVRTKARKPNPLTVTVARSFGRYNFDLTYHVTVMAPVLAMNFVF